MASPADRWVKERFDATQRPRERDAEAHARSMSVAAPAAPAAATSVRPERARTDQVNAGGYLPLVDERDERASAASSGGSSSVRVHRTMSDGSAEAAAPPSLQAAASGSRNQRAQTDRPGITWTRPAVPHRLALPSDTDFDIERDRGDSTVSQHGQAVRGRAHGGGGGTDCARVCALAERPACAQLSEAKDAPEPEPPVRRVCVVRVCASACASRLSVAAPLTQFATVCARCAGGRPRAIPALRHNGPGARVLGRRTACACARGVLLLPSVFPSPVLLPICALACTDRVASPLADRPKRRCWCLTHWRSGAFCSTSM